MCSSISRKDAKGTGSCNAKAKYCCIKVILLFTQEDAQKAIQKSKIAFTPAVR